MKARRLDRLPVRLLSDGTTARVAVTFRARLLGMAFLGEPPAHALLFPGCRSVHTFGMRFPLDIVFLDSSGRAMRIERGVTPGRVLSCRRASAVLESAASPRRRRAARAAASGRSAPGPR